VAELYKSFFVQYEADEFHNAERHLSHLFKLAEKAKADLKWLGTATDPWLVVMDHNDIGSYSPYYEVVQEFMCHTQLYSWPYIAFMRTQLSEAGRIRLLSIAAFLSILKRTTFDPNKLSVFYDSFLNLKVGSTD
jgi:hypothetical protein